MPKMCIEYLRFRHFRVSVDIDNILALREPKSTKRLAENLCLSDNIRS